MATKKKTIMENWNEIFDLKDGVLYWKISPYKRIKLGTKAGTLTDEGYIAIGYKKKRYYSHRIVFEMIHGYCPKIIDHLNGKKSDNEPCNLRDATYQENSFNRLGTSKSGFKGVYWVENRKKWIAQLKINGKNYQIGRYKDINEAKTAVISFRNKYHGEFANNGHKS